MTKYGLRRTSIVSCLRTAQVINASDQFDIVLPMKPTPPEAHHYEISNGDHTVVVVPTKWRTMHGRTWVTRACARCKTCEWDTPTLFSVGAVDSVARRHLGLLLSDSTSKVEGEA